MRTFQLDWKLYNAARTEGAAWPTIDAWLIHLAGVVSAIGWTVIVFTPDSLLSDTGQVADDGLFQVAVPGSEKCWAFRLDRTPGRLEELLKELFGLGVLIPLRSGGIVGGRGPDPAEWYQKTRRESRI